MRYAEYRFKMSVFSNIFCISVKIKLNIKFYVILQNCAKEQVCAQLVKPWALFIMIYIGWLTE